MDKKKRSDIIISKSIISYLLYNQQSPLTYPRRKNKKMKEKDTTTINLSAKDFARIDKLIKQIVFQPKYRRVVK